MSTLRIQTELGVIDLTLLPQAAPQTVQHIQKAVSLNLYSDTCFYRSDFVIQCGLHGTRRSHPDGSLPVNETRIGGIMSNQRGTVAIAHHDVPDNGSTEMFINLGDNRHLDTAYGGYCVFAKVKEDDTNSSFQVVDSIATTIKETGRKPKIISMNII